MDASPLCADLNTSLYPVTALDTLQPPEEHSLCFATSGDKRCG